MRYSHEKGDNMVKKLFILTQTIMFHFNAFADVNFHLNIINFSENDIAITQEKEKN